jgi:acid phosphatase family membrane protein YuiD
MNTSLNEILYNQPLIATAVAWFLAQLIKTIIDAIKEHRFDFKWLALPGGFPSSHSAAVAALATSIGLKFGFNSGLFSISMVLAGLIIFEAGVIRRAAGRQAEVLNKIVEDLYKKRKLQAGRLKELLGHTPFEVFFGILLGIIVGILLSY